MEHLVGIIAILAVFSVPLAAILGSFYLKAQKLKASQNGGDGAFADLRQQVGNLMAENEEIKEELRNIKYLLSQDAHKQPIDIKEYEKQQIEIDKRNKFEL